MTGQDIQRPSLQLGRCLELLDEIIYTDWPYLGQGSQMQGQSLQIIGQ